MKASISNYGKWPAKFQKIFPRSDFFLRAAASGAPQFGPVAEDVANVAPDLVMKDEKDKPFGVRYDEVNAMLLNEFLKEHRQVEAQDETIATQQGEIGELKAAMAEMRATLKTQSAQIQNVSAQVAGDHAPRIVSTKE